MSRSILIIEDDPDISQLIEMHLGDNGYNTLLAATGEEGVEKFRQNAVDLVVLDVMLPGMDGLEVCRTLRSQQTYVPILMLTAKSTELDRVVGLEMGADDYLTKPFSIPELVARVRALLRRVDALLRREIALANPLLDFDDILFIKRHFCPGRESLGNHMCDQYFGFHAVRGGGLYVLSSAFGPRLIAPRVSTLGGLITAHLGRAPRAGDSVELGNVRVDVEQVDRSRVVTAIVTLTPGPEESGEAP